MVADQVREYPKYVKVRRKRESGGQLLSDTGVARNHAKLLLIL